MQESQWADGLEGQLICALPNFISFSSLCRSSKRLFSDGENPLNDVNAGAGLREGACIQLDQRIPKMNILNLYRGESFVITLEFY